MDIVPSNDSTRNFIPKTTFIYVLRDPETNVIRYVGKANNLEKRLQRHLQKDVDCYRKRWIDSLKRRGLIPAIEMVEEVPYAQWPERERYWIAYFRSQGCDLTNTATGGNGGSGPVSAEARAKISAANTGRKFPPMSEETRRKMSASRKGRKVAPEAIAKTAAGLRGKKASPETRAKLSEAHKGQTPNFWKGDKHTPEARAKMSEAAKGRKRGPMSEETKRKIGESQKGKVISDETRARLSASHKGQTPAMKGRKHTPEARAKMSMAKRKSLINPPDTPTLWD